MAEALLASSAEQGASELTGKFPLIRRIFASGKFDCSGHNT